MWENAYLLISRRSLLGQEEEIGTILQSDHLGIFREYQTFFFVFFYGRPLSRSRAFNKPFIVQKL